MEDLDIDMMYVTPTRTRKLGDVGGSYTYFAEGDVLLAKITPCFQNGKLSIARGLRNSVGFGSSEFIVLRPRSALQAEYLYYFLSQAAFRNEGVARMGGSVGQQRVPIEYVLDQRIPLPSLPEQRRIVEILDEAFAAIAKAKANTERNLQNARAVFESRLFSMFVNCPSGWLTASIGEHIRFIDYRGKTPSKTESGLRLITAKNVKMGFLQLEPIEYVAEDSYESWMTRGIPKRGDVLFTTEAPLANVAQLDTDERVVFAQRIIVMQPDPAVLDARFVKYMLMSSPVQRRIRARGTGATVQGIKASLLRTIPIEYPPTIDAQRSIVCGLDALNEMSTRANRLAQSKLAALDSLKQSLLHHAFTGQLTAKAADRIMATA